ncbi:extracellular solute-binding protein [Paenibacillus eucommiae]|uniref:ABC-type glycerol-3-phosphate transport system substrate-binding protein n=1 Tax=Paenibacillus eucommiae TaxID=1355755 RepID=A0ABS4IV99_9BACL|nr:extracellular solute-binding protein [Paenibacillus eucommiae]MBP1990761.1 ABC-type glycerol-3-phosphate transport system substrate-binding protein [Paenibacillus eucommiae]
MNHKTMGVKNHRIKQGGPRVLIRRKKSFRISAVLLAALVLACSPGITPKAERASYAAEQSGQTEPSKPSEQTDQTEPSKPSEQTDQTDRSPKQAAQPDPDSRMNVQIDQFEPYYSEVLAAWQKQGYADAKDEIMVNGREISSQSDYKLAEVGAYEGKDQVLIWKSNRDNWIEYQIEVAESGLYELELSYHPYDASSSSSSSSTGVNRRPVTLSIEVDSAYSFREARAVSFRRLFKDELPVKRDANGDDIRPRPVEIKKWIKEPFRDSGGMYTEPLKWYLGSGVHKIRLTGSEPVVIEALRLKPTKQLESYEQTAASYPAGGVVQSQEPIIVQMEEMAAKNDVSIQIQSNNDSKTYPDAGGQIRFNAVGAERWAGGGQKISWTFTVPESGRYKMAMRAFQGYSSNKANYRTIYIDDKVPFKELLAYRFPYSSKWSGTILQKDDGNPFVFYLEKGEHVLTMEVTIAPFQPVIAKTDEINRLLREIAQELKAVTGGQVDKNRTWKMETEYPELPGKLQQTYEMMQQMAGELLQANGKRDNTLQSLGTAMKDMEQYLQYPNEIPYYVNEIAAMQEKMGAIREALIKAPLLLDQLYIVPAEGEFPKMVATFTQKAGAMIKNFFHSFLKKDDLSNLEEDALNVWVFRGRDYVNLLQELADEMYTPEFGTKVKINLLPSENLLILANAAGLMPDVALGQPQDKPVDFAMRNALLDLSQFADFPEVASQFAPGALLPYYYNKGYYALPETQSFRVLFYRKDILSRLNLSLPETWEDVYGMIPTLQQNGFNFYMPSGDYLHFFNQNGADVFTEDGMKTALDTPEAFKGFKQWTDVFNIYDMDPAVSNFYQHFRKGDMPIGIADYNMYVMMSVAAPELTGWWGIAPLPGVKQADGTVARWAAGGQTSAFIYKNTTRKEEAWTFVKWLLSADVQERYGADLEAFNGIEFRWNSANIDAFTRLPWPKEDQSVILEQWKWYKEMPSLPGAYYVGRELTNAWNRTVVDGMNYRESLEQAVVDINREMLRKEQEFGFVNKDGSIVDTLHWPQVKQPWEGVDKYADQ